MTWRCHLAVAKHTWQFCAENVIFFFCHIALYVIKVILCGILFFNVAVQIPCMLQNIPFTLILELFRLFQNYSRLV